MKENEYGKHYSEESFWNKLQNFAKKAGKKVIYISLLGYYALENPKVSKADKAVIIGALGYFIFPVDLVPDFVPVAGFGDDLSILLFAIGRVAMHIDKEVKKNALWKMENWFGAIDQEDKEIIDIEAEIVEVEKGAEEAAAEAAAAKEN